MVLAHKFLMKAGSNAIASVLSFVSLMVMTRYVGEQYGLMMWGWAFVAMFNCVTDLGFNSANLKYVSKRDSNQNSYFTTFLVLKVALSVIAMVASLASCLLTASSDAMNAESIGVCLVFSLYFVAYNIQTAISVSFDARLETGKASAILAIEAIVRAIALMIMAMMGVDAITLSMGYVLGIAASVAVTTYLYHRCDLHLERPRFFREYAVFAAPIAFSIMSVSVIEYLDKVLIGFFGTPLDVGNYTAAFGVVGAFTTLGASLNNILLPHLSKDGVSAEKDTDTVWMIEKYLSALLLPILTFILILGPEIGIVLYGSDYVESGYILSIQSVHIYAYIMVGMLAQVLYAAGKSSIYLKGTIIFTIISLIGYVLLIPSTFGGVDLFGLSGRGASLALSIAYTILLIFVIVQVRKVTGIGMYPRLWRCFVAAAFGGIFLLALHEIFGISGLIPLAIAGIASEVMFIIVLRLLGEFGRKEIDFVKTLLNPRLVKESLSDEMK